MTRQLIGLSDEVRQAWRDQVLSATSVDLQALGDVFDEIANHGRIVVIGSPTALESATHDRGPGWMEIAPLL
jgi:Zn-dependent M16 (insulinase) family peptidase